MRRRDIVRNAGLAALVLAAFAATVHAGDPDRADKWAFAVRPYLWAPSIGGTLKYEIPPGGGGSATVDLASYILQNLNFALMLTAEARKGDWSLLTDVVYLDVRSDDSTVKSVNFSGPGGRVEVSVGADLGTTVRLTGFLGELAGSYTVARGGATSIDFLAGLRYLTLEAGTGWRLSGSVTGPGPGQSFARSGSVSQREELWDGIVGVRGRVGLGGGSWAIPYYLDAGAGSSAFTWQGVGGIEYRFSRIDLQLLYRYLYYDMKGDKMLQNVSFYGPALGVNFRF